LIQKHYKKESGGHIIYRLLLIFTGALLAALSIERFLVPNQMIDGGIIGISLILDYILPEN
jgi:uncharacterized membrane-anchored protein YitT (DUF2179 family)